MKVTVWQWQFPLFGLRHNSQIHNEQKRRVTYEKVSQYLKYSFSLAAVTL